MRKPLREWNIKELANLKVRDVDETGVLVHVHHVGVEAREMEHVLRKAGKSKL